MIKYNNIICCIAKDETPYLNEWVEHHLNIGVQNFVIYDNNSDVPVKQTLAKYINKGLVSVIDCPETSLPQVKAYNHCLYQMSGKTQWIAFIDIDEFIILNKHKQMNEMLKEYDSFAGLCLNWELHNASGHIFNPRLPVLDAYKDYLPHTSSVNRHVKTILQPRFTTAMNNPHYAVYESGYYAINEKYLPVGTAFSDFTNEVAHVNHYFTKSFEEWIDKVKRGKADTNGQRNLDEFWFYNPQMLSMKDAVEKKFRNTFQSCFASYVSKNLSINASRWDPLVAGEERQKIEHRLKKIGMIVYQHGRQTKNIGLFWGQSGSSLFLFKLGKAIDNPLYEDWANEILENIVTNIRTVHGDHSFASGLCGIGWLIEYLAQNRFVENNTNEILSELDGLFKDSIFNLLDFSLTKGLMSYGMYFLARSANPENFNIQQKELLVQIVNYLECFLPVDKSEADEPENLTMLQGYLGVIPFLCKVYEININRYKVLCVLNKYVNLVLSCEERGSANLCFPNQIQNGTCMLQWNCGDLAVANVLLQAAKVTKNKEWESKALQIILKTISEKDIENLNCSIGNGTAGVAYLYNRFYQYYRNPELKIASLYWLNRTIELLDSQRELTNFGLIDGLAGTGLVLLAAISETEPTWDSALLIA